jgi:hypothetical protein
MSEFWQTLTAWGIVGLTLTGFAWRFATRARRHCGGHCDCPMAGANTTTTTTPSPGRTARVPARQGTRARAMPVARKSS